MPAEKTFREYSPKYTRQKGGFESKHKQIGRGERPMHPLETIYRRDHRDPRLAFQKGELKFNARFGGVDFEFKKYKIYEFPDVTIDGRTENLPIHIHVHYPGNKIRINCETLKELDGLKIPKYLRRFLKINKDETKLQA